MLVKFQLGQTLSSPRTTLIFFFKIKMGKNFFTAIQKEYSMSKPVQSGKVSSESIKLELDICFQFFPQPVRPKCRRISIRSIKR